MVVLEILVWMAVGSLVALAKVWLGELPKKERKVVVKAARQADCPDND